MAADPARLKTAWSDAWREKGRSRHALAVMAWPHVLPPHAVVAAAGALPFLLAPPTDLATASDSAPSGTPASGAGFAAGTPTEDVRIIEPDGGFQEIKPILADCPETAAILADYEV